jgi:hypothetical protein
MTSLNEEKSSAEDNAAKTIALDYLGVIAARIRSSLIRTKARIKKEAGDDQARGPFALAEVGSSLAPLADFVVNTCDFFLSSSPGWTPSASECSSRSRTSS